MRSPLSTRCQSPNDQPLDLRITGKRKWSPAPDDDEDADCKSTDLSSGPAPKKPSYEENIKPENEKGENDDDTKSDLIEVEDDVDNPKEVEFNRSNSSSNNSACSDVASPPSTRDPCIRYFWKICTGILKIRLSTLRARCSVRRRWRPKWFRGDFPHFWALRTSCEGSTVFRVFTVE